MRRIFQLALLLWLAACSPEPVPATPALWKVEAPDGRTGWLFGTIHAFDRPVLWRTPAVDQALEQAGLLVVEVADLDGRVLTDLFAKLARSPGQPPLSARVRPQFRADLAELLDEHGLHEDQFAEAESWAVALMLAQAASADMNSKYGIDRAVVEAAGNRPIAELEGAAGQLALFDTLGETEQRHLLEAIIVDARSIESAALSEAWREGDMALIERETERGLLAHPRLRTVLFTQRNQDWSEQIAAHVAQGSRPFVAVGAAHLAGSEGLPMLLSEMGYMVTRIQ